MKTSSSALEQAVVSFINLPREYVIGSPTHSVVSISIASSSSGGQSRSAGNSLKALWSRYAVTLEDEATAVHKLMEMMDGHVCGAISEYVNYASNAKVPQVHI